MDTQRMPGALPRLAYRIDEVAEALTVSKDLVRLWHRQKKITITKIGSRTVIMADELQRFLAENAKPAA